MVGGRVTPDKLYVYQKDDGSEVVIRFMGSKTMKIVYDENGGTKEVPVPERECMLWALTPTQAEQVAKGVRAVSKAYDGMIMDTEFCIDSKGMLWFVQARPETRWNEELALHPHTIFMRRREVEPKAAAAAEILLTGNGASRGAGQGKVRFLRSALELNRVGKGEILAAERTDPDMVPGMRVASAILADVGGDTSHAAITSRELGIAAVIGIQNPTALQALDGLDVTVDGTRGRVYRGLLPLHEVGGEMDVEALPQTKTRVGLVLADIGQALFLSRLRNVPDFEVGLLRAEFMLGNVGVHPAALEAFDNGELERLVQKKIGELDSKLRKTIREQLEAREHDILSPWATFADESAGREREMQPCPYRTCFQRDRDRILHCNSFRRLKRKTQVFLSPAGADPAYDRQDWFPSLQDSRSCLLSDQQKQTVAREQIRPQPHKTFLFKISRIFRDLSIDPGLHRKPRDPL